jgi:hypothetical protein
VRLYRLAPPFPRRSNGNVHHPAYSSPSWTRRSTTSTSPLPSPASAALAWSANNRQCHRRLIKDPRGIWDPPRIKPPYSSLRWNEPGARILLMRSSASCMTAVVEAHRAGISSRPASHRISMPFLRLCSETTACCGRTLLCEMTPCPLFPNAAISARSATDFETHAAHHRNLLRKSSAFAARALRS